MCFESCDEDKYDYNNFCFYKCPKYTILKDKICEDNRCKFDNSIDCLGLTPKHYFLDNNDYLYKDCYNKCNYCYGKGNDSNNNCIECISPYILLEEPNNYNCYEKCEYYYYFDEYNNYKCTNDNKCPEKYNKLVTYKNKCINQCFNDDSYKYEYNNSCYIQCPENTYLLNYHCIDEIKNNEKIIVIIKENKTKVSNELYLNIKDSITKELKKTNFNKSIVYTDESLELTFALETTKSLKESKNISNITTIDLGICETKLKIENHIPINDSLYILMINALFLKEKIQKVDYEVYYSFNKINLTKLDLSICKDKKIEISIPRNIPINEIDKYNLSSDLYNDICYTLENEDGIDKPIKVRRKESIDNNIFICEENCEFSRYDNVNKKAICSCYTKISLPLVSDIKINKDKLLSNFKNINNIANIKMLTCLNQFFYIDNILKNSANYMLIILFPLSLISLFVFLFYNSSKIQNYFEEIKKKIASTNSVINKNNINNTINNNKINKNKTKAKSKRKKSNSIVGKQNKEFIVVAKNDIIEKSINLPIFTRNYINMMKKRKSAGNNKISEDYNSLQRFLTKNKEKRTLNNEKNIKEKRKPIKKNFEQYNDAEMNLFTYEEAIKNDKRTFSQYYCSLIKTKHILIFSFFNNKDYNSQLIKIYIFFFTFAINLTVSALFYSENTMSKIYYDKGSFDITYQLPQILYSFLISSVLKSLLNILGLYENNILEIKSYKNNDLNKNNKALSLIKLKIAFFFIITYILLMTFWLFLGCFCAVYKNTQIHLLYDVSLSFALSFITPFFVYLLPGIFRIPSLKVIKRHKPNRSVMYNFSKILQML